MSNHEELRSDALRRYEILNTPPEPNFDRITRIASSVLGRPVCTLALVDRDRFWFKSKQGVDATEMPRRMAFCDQTIQGEDVFVVHDALNDLRFRDAPVVKGAPHFRFYAGAPLVTPSGTAIGSLCVLDVKPEPEFSDQERRLLGDLASTVVELFEARARQIDLLRCTDEIAYLARHDPLTNLPNRRRLAELHAPLARAQHEGGVALLYLDLDGFKAVNDIHGHACGDNVLRQVSDRIREALPPDAHAARLGGDEFAILLTANKKDLKDDASALARDLMGRIEVPYTSLNLRVRIGCTIGIALSGGGSDLKDLLRRADESLYRAKAQGRGRFLFEAA